MLPYSLSPSPLLLVSRTKDSAQRKQRGERRTNTGRTLSPDMGSGENLIKEVAKDVGCIIINNNNIVVDSNEEVCIESSGFCVPHPDNKYKGSFIAVIGGGYRRRKKNTTLEEYWPIIDGHTNITGGTTQVATNFRSYLNSKIPERDSDRSNNDNGNQSHQNKWASAKDCHAHRGSRWSESKTTCRFRAQSRQFDTGTRNFNSRSRPSATELIASIQRKNQTALLLNNNSNLVETVFQIAKHESSAKNQITRQVDDFWRKTAYGKAPGIKPDNCVRVVMENFNSLGFFTNGVKINALNKLCRKFKTDILTGWETQADWRQATNKQQFQNIIGVGMDTRSVVAHNINEWMQRNQHGGCAMMAMGRFLAEVVETGVDHYGLGRWCWMKVG
jgi:hypothetical protein